MKKIRAIETHYKGYLFRSRIEARFAVFFDVLKLDWEYEKEGFECGDAGWYLPDFYLPKSKWFVEIKGGKISKNDQEKINYLDNYPPEYAYGCLVLKSEDLNPKTRVFHEHPLSVFFAITPNGIDIRDIYYALDVAKSARFDHGNSIMVV